MVKIKKNKIKPQTAVEMPEEIVPPPKKRSSEDPVPQKVTFTV